MKTILQTLATCITMLFGLVVQAQCPPGDIELTSQAEVDAFATNYPNCTEIEGYLLIGILSGSTDITDLLPLSNLTSIQGGSDIYGNPLLTSLSGLESLSDVNGFFGIYHNPQLTSLSGLNNLTYAGNLYVMENDALTSLSGLENLTSIGGPLAIAHNDALTSLSGLESLSAINGFLEIYTNPQLTDISALQHIDPATIQGGMFDGLTIMNNPVLSVCSLPNFCTYLQDSGTSNISGNAGDCISEAAVLAACALSVDDTTFADSILLYPNPAKDFVTLANLQNHSTIKVVDITGKVVLEVFNTTGTAMLNTGNLSNGVYIVQIENERNTAVKKLVVKR